VLITEDYFANGKNLFPTSGATQQHLAQLLIDLQKASATSGFTTQIVTVGEDGEYTEIQNALADIDDASITKPYIVRLGPKRFAEEVTLKPYVFLVGSGEARTIVEGRVVGPSSGVAGLYGIDIQSALAVAALDIGAGTLVGAEVSITQTGTGRSMRITGGVLRFSSLAIYDGGFQVTGGECSIGQAIFQNLSSSQISGGLMRVLDWIAVEAVADPPVSIIGGRLECGRMEISNSIGDYISMSGGVFEYQSMLIRSMVSDALVLVATGGTIYGGLRNWALGVKAFGSIEILNNTFDAGDTVTVNGVGFEKGVQFVVGIDTDATAENLRAAIAASIDTAILGVLVATIDGGSPSTVDLTAVRAGTEGNAITLAETDGATNNFALIQFSGGLGKSQISGATIVNMSVGL